MPHHDVTPQASDAPSGRLGILGGGQLGMLLCRAARRLGVATTVMTADPGAPALQVADEGVVAALDDEEQLERLIAGADVVTFEIEAIPEETLRSLEAAERRGELAVRPGIDTLALLKDKGRQKRWFREQNLPTLPFLCTDEAPDRGDLERAGLQPPLVQKSRRGGYDGRGVQMLHAPEELANMWPVPSVFEPALLDCTEAAVVVAADGLGNASAYPAVSMRFDPSLNAVRTVVSPGDLDEAVRAACSHIAIDAVTALGSAGVFAVEFFVAADGAVFINEISPRVHNSGHLTMDAFRYDQFEQHVRAVMGLPLAPVIPHAPAAVMINLLYEEPYGALLSPSPYSIALDDPAHTVLHWYGKSEPRPGRKMGHVNALGMSVEVAERHAEAGLEALRRDSRPPGPGIRKEVAR